MSVNVYDAEHNKLSPLTSMFASPVIIDVEELPTLDIEDAIYRVASDSWSFKGIALSAVDMTVNTTNLEEVGCTTDIDGNIYTYTPDIYNIRYYRNNEQYLVSKIKINSINGEMTIYGADGVTIILQSIIETGLEYPFYISKKWTTVTVTLSHTNMAADQAALRAIGFKSSTDDITYTYEPNDYRFRYNNYDVSKITIAAADGRMIIYDDTDTAIYDNIIVDGPYTFSKSSDVKYYVGNKETRKFDQLAKISDISSSGGSSVSSLQEIFDKNPDQIINGYNNVMTFIDDQDKIEVLNDSLSVNTTVYNLDVEANRIELFRMNGETKLADFEVNKDEMAINDSIKESLKTRLNIYDVQKMITENVETDPTMASKPYEIDDLLVLEDKLYIVIAPILAGSPFSIDGNISNITIEEFVNSLINSNSAIISSISSRLTELERTVNGLIQNG